MKLGLALLGLLSAALLAADLAYHKHGHYPVEEWFGSFPAIGLLACLTLALAARVLAVLTRRDTDPYPPGRREEAP